MLVSNGNHKIGKDTIIFNITSATDCVGRKLNLCQIPDKCYAMKAERMYKQVLPYRRRQTDYWNSNSAQVIAENFMYEINRHKKTPIKYVRLGESGDFRAQEDIDKFIEIGKIFLEERPDIVLYCFTSRSDLDFSERTENMVVNGSGFMLDNSFTVRQKDEEIPETAKLCAGNCRICDLCKHKTHADIRVTVH